jgi:Recombination endonuclease VII
MDTTTADAGTKQCNICKEFLPYSRFPPSSNKKKYPNAAPGKHLQAYCYSCGQIYRNKWRKENPEKYRKSVRSYHVRSRYNVSHEEAERLDAISECEICGSNNRLGIDHCHDSNKIRGILCNSCNLALGWADDNIEILEKMISYLKEKQ